MSYPAWNSATSYPLGSIVTFNGQVYKATYFHDPANNDPPNVEFGPGPYPVPAYGSLRGWIIWAELPAGYTESMFTPIFFLLSIPYDPADRYAFSATEPNPYGGGALYGGRCEHAYTGTTNNPSTPCPVGKCGVQLSTLSSLYGDGFYFEYLVNPVLYTNPATGQTSYINGTFIPGTSNQLHGWVWFRATYCFRRTFTVECEVDGVMESRTATPTDYNYLQDPYGVPHLQPPSPPGVWDTPYFAPGTQSVQFTVINSYNNPIITEVENND
jgi:hypothetical protein